MNTPAAINLFGCENNEWTKEARDILNNLGWRHNFVFAESVPGSNRPGNPYGLDIVPTIRIDLPDMRIELAGIERIRKFEKTIRIHNGFSIEMKPNK